MAMKPGLLISFPFGVCNLCRATNRSLRKLFRPLSSSYHYTSLDIISSHHTLLIISVRGAFYAIRIGCLGSVIRSNSNSQQA